MKCLDIISSQRLSQKLLDPSTNTLHGSSAFLETDLDADISNQIMLYGIIYIIKIIYIVT